MWYYLVLSILSFGALAYIVAGKVKYARESVPENELLTALKSSKPFFEDYRIIVLVPLVRYWQIFIYPFILRETEKGLSSLRQFILKIEKEVGHIRDYVRGKRILHINGKRHHYWGELNEHKTENPGKMYE